MYLKNTIKISLFILFSWGLVLTGIAQSDTSTTAVNDTSTAAVVKQLMKVQEEMRQRDKDTLTKIKKFIHEFFDIDMLEKSLQVSRGRRDDTVRNTIEIAFEQQNITYAIQTRLNLDEFWPRILNQKKRLTHEGKVAQDLTIAGMSLETLFLFDTVGNRNTYRITPVFTYSPELLQMFHTAEHPTAQATIDAAIKKILQPTFTDIKVGQKLITQTYAYLGDELRKIHFDYMEVLALDADGTKQATFERDIDFLAQILDKNIENHLHHLSTTDYLFEYQAPGHVGSVFQVSEADGESSPVADYLEDLRVVNPSLEDPFFCLVYRSDYMLSDNENRNLCEKVLQKAKNVHRLPYLQLRIINVYQNGNFTYWHYDNNHAQEEEIDKVIHPKKGQVYQNVQDVYEDLQNTICGLSTDLELITGKFPLPDDKDGCGEKFKFYWASTGDFPLEEDIPHVMVDNQVVSRQYAFLTPRHAPFKFKEHIKGQISDLVFYENGTLAGFSYNKEAYVAVYLDRFKENANASNFEQISKFAFYFKKSLLSALHQRISLSKALVHQGRFPLTSLTYPSAHEYGLLVQKEDCSTQFKVWELTGIAQNTHIYFSEATWRDVFPTAEPNSFTLRSPLFSIECVPQFNNSTNIIGKIFYERQFPKAPHRLKDEVIRIAYFLNDFTTNRDALNTCALVRHKNLSLYPGNITIKNYIRYIDYLEEKNRQQAYQHTFARVDWTAQEVLENLEKTSATQIYETLFTQQDRLYVDALISNISVKEKVELLLLLQKDEDVQTVFTYTRTVDIHPLMQQLLQVLPAHDIDKTAQLIRHLRAHQTPQMSLSDRLKAIELLLTYDVAHNGTAYEEEVIKLISEIDDEDITACHERLGEHMYALMGEYHSYEFMKNANYGRLVQTFMEQSLRTITTDDGVRLVEERLKPFSPYYISWDNQTHGSDTWIEYKLQTNGLLTLTYHTEHKTSHNTPITQYPGTGGTAHTYDNLTVVEDIDLLHTWMVVKPNKDIPAFKFKKGNYYPVPAIVIYYLLTEQDNNQLRAGVGFVLDMSSLMIGLGQLSAGVQGVTRLVAMIDVVSSSTNMILTSFEDEIKTIVPADVYNDIKHLNAIVQIASATAIIGPAIVNKVGRTGVRVVNWFENFGSNIKNINLKNSLTQLVNQLKQMVPGLRNSSDNWIQALPEELKSVILTDEYQDVKALLQNSDEVTRSRLVEGWGILGKTKLCSNLDALSVVQQYISKYPRDGYKIKAFLSNTTEYQWPYGGIAKYSVQESFNKVFSKRLDELFSTLEGEELVAIHHYSKGIAYPFNQAKRGVLKMTDFFKVFDVFLESGLSKLNSYIGTVHRGTALPESYVLSKYREAFKNSTKIREKAYTSTSKVTDFLGDYMTRNMNSGDVNVIFRIKSKTGKDIEKISNFGSSFPNNINHKEVLFKSRTTFEVTNFKSIKDNSDNLLYYEVFLSEF